MTHLASGALGFWAANLISIDQFEHETTYGFAALLLAFASRAAQPRLLAKLEPAQAATAPRRVHQGAPAGCQGRFDRGSTQSLPLLAKVAAGWSDEGRAPLSAKAFR